VSRPSGSIAKAAFDDAAVVLAGARPAAGGDRPPFDYQPPEPTGRQGSPTAAGRPTHAGPLTTAAARIAAGTTRSVDLVADALDRIEGRDGELHAMVALNVRTVRAYD